MLSHIGSAQKPLGCQKTARFIKTLQEEWSKVKPYGTSAARNTLQSRYLRIEQHPQGHMAQGGRTPQQRLIQLLE